MPGSRYLIPLGAGHVGAAGAGNKAALLDRSKSSGLPVPAGYALLAEAKGRLRQAPAFHGKIAVRAAFSAEDHPWESLAGFFLSKLWVDAKNPEELHAAVAEVWQSAARRPGEFRRDILLHEMVNARTSGVASTERDFEDDLVHWTRGTGERLVAGDIRGYALELPKLRGRETSRLAPAAPAFASRVQELLRDVRRVFGPHDWAIEWADDGRICWLLQLGPITRPLPRNEAFTPIAGDELWPELSTRLIAGVGASCAPALYAAIRDFDPSLPNDRLLAEVFEGRLLLNLSLLGDTLRMLGLPERLAGNPFGLEFERPTPANWGRLARKWPVLLRLLFAQFGSVARARRTARSLQALAARTPGSFRDALEHVRWFYTVLAKELLALNATRIGARALAAALYPLRGPLRWQAARADQALELLRAGAVPAWDLLRGTVLAQAAEAGLAGNEFWQLSEEEVFRLDEGWRPSRAVLAERQRETDRLAQARLPGIVRRFDEFQLFYPEPGAAETPAGQSF